MNRLWKMTRRFWRHSGSAPATGLFMVLFLTATAGGVETRAMSMPRAILQLSVVALAWALKVCYEKFATRRAAVTLGAPSKGRPLHSSSTAA